MKKMGIGGKSKMGKYKEFKKSLNENQEKQFERYTLEWYVYGVVVGVAAVLIPSLMGVI